jgi:hypothetical protein
MIKQYKYDYSVCNGSATFEIDTDKFTSVEANETLKFFCWDYNKEADPIEEVMKKYALEVISVATEYNYNETGVIEEFNTREGFCKLDGSSGIKLTSSFPYEFNEDELTVEIKTIEE